MSRDTQKVTELKASAQHLSAWRLCVFRPQLLKQPVDLTYRYDPVLVTTMEATQQPLNVWFQVDQVQFFITQGSQRVTAMQSIIVNPIGIEENHCGGIRAVAPALPMLFYRVFDDPKTISATTDANIEMDMETCLFA